MSAALEEPVATAPHLLHAHPPEQVPDVAPEIPDAASQDVKDVTANTTKPDEENGSARLTTASSTYEEHADGVTVSQEEDETIETPTIADATTTEAVGSAQDITADCADVTIPVEPTTLVDQEVPLQDSSVEDEVPSVAPGSTTHDAEQPLSDPPIQEVVPSAEAPVATRNEDPETANASTASSQDAAISPEDIPQTTVKGETLELVNERADVAGETTASVEVHRTPEDVSPAIDEEAPAEVGEQVENVTPIVAVERPVTPEEPFVTEATEPDQVIAEAESPIKVLPTNEASAEALIVEDTPVQVEEEDTGDAGVVEAVPAQEHTAVEEAVVSVDEERPAAPEDIHVSVEPEPVPEDSVIEEVVPVVEATADPVLEHSQSTPDPTEEISMEKEESGVAAEESLASDVPMVATEEAPQGPDANETVDVVIEKGDTDAVVEVNEPSNEVSELVVSDSLHGVQGEDLLDATDVDNSPPPAPLTPSIDVSVPGVSEALLEDVGKVEAESDVVQESVPVVADEPVPAVVEGPRELVIEESIVEEPLAPTEELVSTDALIEAPVTVAEPAIEDVAIPAMEDLSAAATNQPVDLEEDHEEKKEEGLADADIVESRPISEEASEVPVVETTVPVTEAATDEVPLVDEPPVADSPAIPVPADVVPPVVVTDLGLTETVATDEPTPDPVEAVGLDEPANTETGFAAETTPVDAPLVETSSTEPSPELEEPTPHAEEDSEAPTDVIAIVLEEPSIVLEEPSIVLEESGSLVAESESLDESQLSPPVPVAATADDSVAEVPSVSEPEIPVDEVVVEAVDVSQDQASAPVGQVLVEDTPLVQEIVESSDTSVKEDIAPVEVSIAVDEISPEITLPVVSVDATEDEPLLSESISEPPVLSGSRSPSLQERPKSPWTPSYSVTTQGPGTVEDTEAEIAELELLPPPVADVVTTPQVEITTEPSQEPEPESATEIVDGPAWVPSYSVSSQGASPLHSPCIAATELPSEVPLDPPADISTVEPKVEPVESSVQEFARFEAEATVDPQNESIEVSQEQAEAGEEVPPVIELTDEVSDVPVPAVAVESVDTNEAASADSWVPSYSVSSQGPGSISTPPATATDADVVEVDPHPHLAVDNVQEISSLVDVADVPVIAVDVAPTEDAIPSVPQVDPTTTSDHVPMDEASRPPLDETPAYVVETPADAEADAQAPPPASAEDDRPRSPWTPSYSVTQQGNSPLASPVPPVKDLEEVDQLSPPEAPPIIVEEDTSVTDDASEAVNDDQADEPPARTWTPSYSVTRQGPGSDIGDQDATESIEKTVVSADAEKEEAVQTTLASNGNGLHSFPTDEESKKVSSKPSLARLAPVDENEQIQINETSPGPTEVYPSKPRTRLESTTSSRFFPGGWFSSTTKLPEEGRMSLENATGEFARTPSEGAASPTLEVPLNTPIDGNVDESEKKRQKWCVIM